jgi:putative endonuclease
MQPSRRALGAAGEARAVAHLIDRGFRILSRNLRSGGVEIDVIAARGGLVVFAEVKTRRSRRAGLPEEAVDARKQRRLVAGAAAWLREHPGAAARIRFDVIVCEGDADALRVRHLEGAFDASPGY